MAYIKIEVAKSYMIKDKDGVIHLISINDMTKTCMKVAYKTGLTVWMEKTESLYWKILECLNEK